jgi:hypothetical protein
MINIGSGSIASWYSKLELDVDLSIVTSNIILGLGKNRVKRLMGNDPFNEGLFGDLRANPQNNKLFWILIHS